MWQLSRSIDSHFLFRYRSSKNCFMLSWRTQVQRALWFITYGERSIQNNENVSKFENGGDCGGQEQPVLIVLERSLLDHSR